MTTVVLTTTGTGQTWTVPADWNNLSNTITVISAGGNGAVGAAATGGGGGGGGGISVATNVNLSGGTASFQVGTAGGTTGVSGTGASWFNGTATNACSVGIQGASIGTTAGV